MVVSSSTNMNSGHGVFRIYTTSIAANGMWSKLANWTTEAYDYCSDKVDTYSKYAAVVAGCKAVKNKFPIATQFFEIALMEKDEREFTIKEMGGEVLTPKQTEERFKEFGKGGQKVLDKEKRNLYTYVLPGNNKLAKELNKDKALKEFFEYWYNETDRKAKRGSFYTSECENKDIYFTLGQINILGIKDAGNGYVEAYVEDVYDFNEDYGKLNYDKSKKSSFENNIIDKAVEVCTDIQNKGLLSNYRVLIPVRIKVK